ncbi:MAG: DUF2207 domain-containing protein [Balneolaceae bacterium]|nr:DUF2207 domain-containing protein [Balneolaceae bacterium]
MMRYILGIFGLFVIFTLSSTSLSHAKEYTIPEIRVEVQINADGSIRITEHRTYHFDGDYSWANYRLPKKNFHNINDIRISEGNSYYLNKNTEEIGTFLVEESDEAINLKWFYSAIDEERVFTISYTLEGALITGPSWSEFFWIYASSDREKSTDTFHLDVILPQQTLPDSLHYWIREPETGFEAQLNNQGYSFSGTDISRHQRIQIRTVFPTSVLDKDIINITNPGYSLSWARQDEINYQQEREAKAEREAYLFQLGIKLAIVIVGLSLLAFILIYRKYGVRHTINLRDRDSLLIPGNLKPAVVGWLFSGHAITGTHVMATLLDLARKGYFTITENEDTDNGRGSEDDHVFEVSATGKTQEISLKGWEVSMISYVNERIAEGNNSLQEIFKFSESKPRKWFSKWKKEVTAYCKAKGWIDRTSYKGIYWNISIQLFLLAVSIATLIFTHEIVLGASIFTVLCLAFSFVIVRRTPKGEEVFRKWMSYRDALKTAADHSVPDDLLGKHYIYSIALGLSKQNIEQLFKANPEALHALYWIILLPNSTNTPAHIASSMSTLSASGTTSFGGTGGAGGATPGVAGGGASGGAG